jgi:tetratricopeptide (TPR) repeat protein
MVKQLTIFFSLGFVLASCGAKKDLVTTKHTVGASDYPYITMFHEGMRFKAQGRADEAIAKLEGCLAIKQNDDAVYYALSKLELGKGNREKSAEYILKAGEIDPKNTWYIQELAYMYFEMGDFAKSSANFKKLVAIEPRNVEWQYGYAEVLVRTGETEKAIEALNKTEDQVGLNPPLSIEKYNLYMSAKQTDKALMELDKAKKMYPTDPQIIATYVDHYFSSNQQEKAVSMLKELVKADPENGRAHLALADVYLQQKEEQKAYDELTLAFQSPDIDIDTKMKILIRVHESSPKIDPKVTELVQQMVIDYPNESKAHSIQGDYYLRAEQDGPALKAYKRALELDKSVFAIWNQVLIMEYQAKAFDDLYKDGNECTSLFPTNTTVSLLYGVAANQIGKYNEAIDILSIGIEMVINDKRMEAEFQGQLGEAYFGISDFKKGKEHYAKAIQMDAFSSLLKNNYAYRLALAKIDLDLATSLSQQAIIASPNHAQFIDTYGFVLFQMGEYSKAKVEFEKALTFDENDKSVVEHIGDAFFKTGNVQEAIIWWEKAKTLNSSNKNLEKKIQEKKYYEPQF